MTAYTQYLMDHKDEICESFFPKTVPGFLEFWIKVVPGLCEKLYEFDEKKFMERSSDQEWLVSIGLEIPPPVVFTEEQKEFLNLVKLVYKDKNLLYAGLEEFGITPENCVGLSWSSNFTEPGEKDRGTLLPRNKMDLNSKSHDILCMNNLSTD